MQNNDFDRFIQQALENQPVPEYNPAHWDQLEDRLHNLHAPNASQPSAAGKIVSGGANLGKLGFAATAILVTAINVVFFTKPEIFKTVSNKLVTVQNAILSEPKTNESITPTPAPIDNTTVATQEEFASEIGNDPKAIELNDQPETSAENTIIAALPTVTPLEKTVAYSTVKPAAGSKASNAKKANSQNSSKPASGFTWSPSAAGKPGVTAGAGLLGGKPTAALITPCGVEKPELAATLIGTDTLRGSRIGISSCQVLNARFLVKAGEQENLTITSNIAKILPGAKLITDAVSGLTTLKFQPKPEMARQQPYTFTVWVSDSRCPEVASRAYTFALSITPAFTAAINGNTKLEAGQGTTLEVSGAPEGSTYLWLVGKQIVAEKQMRHLIIMPLKTTTYRLAITSPAGCTFSDSVKVEVAEKQVVVNNIKAIPNIFTPNGDGLNDYFEVSLPEEGTFDLEIFDRWGKQVYSRKDYNNSWNAAKLENGTYYYIISTHTTKRTYKGWVEVLR